MSVHAICIVCASVLTYSTTVGSASDGVVLKLEVRIEDGVVQLDATVELVTNLLPVGGRLRHGGEDVLSSCDWHIS